MVSYAKILEIFDMDKPFPHFSPFFAKTWATGMAQ